MTKCISILLVVLLVGTLLAACGGTSSKEEDKSQNQQSQGNKIEGTLEIAGSTSVSPLAQDVADAFMAKYPGVTVNIQSIGSSSGIRAPKDGAAPIGMASRDLRQEEKDWGVKEYVVARDGIAVVGHPANTKADDLTLAQVTKIFKGEITNWSEVGGDDKEIIVVSREEGSGTRGAFEEILDYKGQLRADALIGDGNGNVKANVQNNQYAIGYLSLGFLDETVKTIKVDGEDPTVENIQAGKYPVQRPFIMVTLGEEDELTKAYLEFMLSAEGQTIAANGYIPVK